MYLKVLYKVYFKSYLDGYFSSIFSVFGKTQENLRNRMRVEVVTNRDIAIKRICKPTYKRSQILREDLVVMEHGIECLNLCKPIYVGFCVLDMSKLLMYEFHYQRMQPRYEQLELVFTDTDSLMYHITYPPTSSHHQHNIYTDMGKNSDDYDFSEYPLEHPLFSTVNKKVLGKFKDELNSLPAEEVVALLPKCYSILYCGKVEDNAVVHTDEEEKNTAKGTKEGVKNQFLSHAVYVDTWKNMSSVIVKQNIIKSREHVIGTYHQTKTSLTGFDTKRWICDDNIHTLAYGHVDTVEAMLDCDWDEDVDILL